MLDVLLKNKLLEKSIPFFLVITLFFLPISSSLKSIFILLSALAILLSPFYRNSLPDVFHQNWCKAAIFLFFIALMACIWSPADYQTRLLFVDKYSKLLYLPIFAIGFQHPTFRKLGIHAFLAAMFITCLLSLFKQLNHLAVERLFHDHISTGCMMAFAAYLSALIAAQKNALPRLFYVSLALLFSYQVIFVSTGRIGYIIYFALMILLLTQLFSLKQSIVGIILFCALFVFLGYQSPALQVRWQETMSDLNYYQKGKEVTPVGMRLVFHKCAKSLFLSSPWIGHGTGGFSVFYQKINTAADYTNIKEPHSQYWLVASEFGLLGLIALFYFFIILVKFAFRMQEMKSVMLGILVCFFLSNISDSQLLHSDVGFLFILFTALCLGELIPPNHVKTSLFNEGLNKFPAIEARS